MSANEQDHNKENQPMKHSNIQYDSKISMTNTEVSEINLRAIGSYDGDNTSANDHWKRAAGVVRSNPSLMTREILFLTLKNHPPLHIVEFMVRLMKIFLFVLSVIQTNLIYD